MPKRVIPLTATQVKKAKPRDVEYNLCDSDGLYLRVRPVGSKAAWLFKYSHPVTKKRTNLIFGTYPEISLAAARQHRLEARELLAKGISPKQHRDAQHAANKIAAANTLQQVTNDWMKIKRTKITPDHATDIYRSLEKHVFYRLGNTPISEITAPVVINVIKCVDARGNHDTVKRLCQRLNEIMLYAVNIGLINHNPLEGIRHAFQTAKKQHLPTLSPDKLPDLMKAISKASVKFPTRCLIEFQLHTMVRPVEAAGARWEEIDFKNALWKIPAARMKRRRLHTIPLTPQSLALLEKMCPISEHRDYIFPGNDDPKKSMNASTVNVALKRMGYSCRLVAHGFRSIASTLLNEQGHDPDVIEAALSHSVGNEVRQAYNRSDYLEKRRVMMQFWSNYIDDAANTNTNDSRQADNVAKFKQKV